MMKKISCILFLLLICSFAYTQVQSIDDSLSGHKSEAIKVFFAHNSCAIDLNMPQNREALSRFSDLMETLNRDSLSLITKIEINSYTSPEGGRQYNQKLSERRTEAIYDYLLNIISLPDSIIHKSSSGIDWVGLQRLVQASDMPYKEEVLYILSNVPEEKWRKVNANDRWLSLVDSRNKHLMDLHYGDAYRYMFTHIYPQLRNSAVLTLYSKTTPIPDADTKAELAVVETVETAETTDASEIDFKPASALEPAATTTPERIKKPLLALKTNLLFDAASLINAELEVPIRNRWSVAGEWIFPWWTFDNGKSDSKRNRIQLLNGNLEVKYWFGKRAQLPVLTGWYAGFYAGGGLYDLEHNGKGYQGEFFIAAGLSAGYAHTINRSGTLRMEYSLGLGYLKTDYRYYEAHYEHDNKWHPERHHNGTYTWMGPTKAKISLVWLLHYKSKKGGKR